MAWILMLLIDAVPYSFVIETQEECVAIAIRMANYYQVRDVTMRGLCRKTFEV